jgi:predicted nucleic acid-binding protein
VKAVDTSVVIAAFAEWHPAHVAAQRTLDAGPRLPGHAGLEAYSVLTRLPPPHRAAASDVATFLRDEFREPWLNLGRAQLAAVIDRLASLGITGGATYDAVIGLTVKDAGATLLTRDRRALTIYQRLGVEVEFVG